MTWQPKKLTRAQKTERRLTGGQMLQSGQYTQAAIARELGVSEAAVSQWKTALATQGRRALEAQAITGRPAKLSVKQRRQLERILKGGARQAGFETERWTQGRIQQVIEREFAVHYHQNYISQLMQQLGWSVQLPSSRLVERDEALIRAWLSQDWPRIKKSVAARRDHFV